MTTAQRLARVAARLRAAGFTVVEVAGWQSRGSGALTPRAHLEHHTAGGRSGDTPSLRVVTFGRPGLRNALCTWYVSRSGVIYLIAARAAWHAGRGIKGSNSTLSGTEAENTGVGEPWTAGSLAAQAAIAAEMAREFGFGADRVFDHREHAPSRKIDRTGIDPAAWRRRIAVLLTGQPAVPPPPPPLEDDLMIRPDDTGKTVEQLQRLVNGVTFRAPRVHPDRYELRPTITVDGVNGPATRAAIVHALGVAQDLLGLQLHPDVQTAVTPADVMTLHAAVLKLGEQLAAH